MTTNSANLHARTGAPTGAAAGLTTGHAANRAADRAPGGAPQDASPRPSPASALTGRDLSVLRGPRAILDVRDVLIAPGELTAILGPNGSGKSTLLRVLSGLIRQPAGRVRLGGEPMDRTPRQELARQLTFLPQDTQCDFAFTVEEVVAMGRHPHRGRFDPERDADRRAVDDALAQCNIEHLRLRTMDTLSGGERQRAALARCLATGANVLLLDEPTAHLDLEHALGALRVCRALARAGKAVALATHDLATVSRWATQVIVLQHGRVAGYGPPEYVLTPALCRAVFAVETEIVTTADGRPAFVFSARREPAALGAES